jgi:hypothetical protein
MLIDNQNRLDLESKVLAAAFKQGIDHGDLESADLAHKALFRLIRERHLPNTTSDYLGRLQANRLAAPARTAQGFAPEPAGPGSDQMETESGNGHALAQASQNLTEPASGPPAPESEDLDKANLAPINIYELLGIPHTASVDLIHKTFLKQVRKVLVAKTKTKGVYPRKSLEMLRNLWIAHDILTDENIRADYDINVLGLDSVANPDRTRFQEAAVDTEGVVSLRLGELLREAGLIDQTELQIACDMHKAMREMPFGRFLVKQDFIDEEQLEAVLIGQRLLRDKLIDLAHFQECMDTFTRTGKDLGQIVLESGYVSKADLIKVRDRMRSEQQAAPPEPADDEDQAIMPVSASDDGNGANYSDEQSLDKKPSPSKPFANETPVAEATATYNQAPPASSNPEIGDDSDSELAGVAPGEFEDLN